MGEHWRTWVETQKKSRRFRVSVAAQAQCGQFPELRAPVRADDRHLGRRMLAGVVTLALDRFALFSVRVPSGGFAATEWLR
jgi:hypothetical protein